MNTKKLISKGKTVVAGGVGAAAANVGEKKLANTIKNRKARLGVMATVAVAGAAMTENMAGGLIEDACLGAGIESVKSLIGEFVPKLGITGTGDDVLNGVMDDVLNGVDDEELEGMDDDDDLSGTDDGDDDNY